MHAVYRIQVHAGVNNLRQILKDGEGMRCSKCCSICKGLVNVRNNWQAVLNRYLWNKCKCLYVTVNSFH